MLHPIPLKGMHYTLANKCKGELRERERERDCFHGAIIGMGSAALSAYMEINVVGQVVIPSIRRATRHNQSARLRSNDVDVLF